MSSYWDRDEGNVHPNGDPREGTPDCKCRHSTYRHHGTDRSGSPPMQHGNYTGCKDCMFCDYYMPNYGRSS